mmetsp:Transcript_91197/g.174940  ORF Transcript_91197/g.174940 Transcript_91197/m.174940 type:complete len:389 (-) Transcript_91197:61-1227(-)
MITGLPGNLTVRARQKLKTPEAAEAFNTQLQEKISKHAEAGQTVAFEDFDIAQNPLPYDAFEVLFATFASNNVRVERIRLFGCATLDDSVAHLIAGWLQGCSPETCPYELHLSDCAMTTEGFDVIMQAIESNDAWPFSTKRIPLYMRLENNYIAEPSIQEKVDAGVIVGFTKNDGPIRAPMARAPDAKIKLVVRAPGKYQQKQGVPPSPEDAPPPKPVWDRTTQEEQGQKGGWQQAGAWQKPAWPAQQAGWQQPQAAKGAWQQPVANRAWQQPAWQQPAKPAWQQQPLRPAVGQATKGVGKGLVNQVKNFAKGIHAATTAQQGAAGAKGGLKGSAGSAADRSRTPPPKPAPKKDVLPPDWEEHHSEEYGIPYYWNSKTGESAWEKPDA